MTPAARIQATLELLQAIEGASRPMDALTSNYFRSRRFIGSKDRAAISTRLYAVMRHQARLGFWLKTHNLEANPRSRILAWLALGEAMRVQDINETFSGGKYAPQPLSEAERAFLKRVEGHKIEHPAMPEEVLAECPPECLAALKKKFGAAFMSEMRAMEEPAPLDLRVNALKAKREDIIDELKKRGFKVKATEYSPWGVRVFERPNLNDLPMLKEGFAEIQDEGSQLVAQALGAQPGERVVDFCAGAGGKTLAIGAMMSNKGRIVACDVAAARLKRSSERFRRAGLHNIEARELADARDPWVKKHKASFDRVLVDAPCSGTGTWRRNPDARWRDLGPGLQKLLGTQAEILDSAARLVKAGGVMVYATCSLLPEENEVQIENFLKTHPEFSLQACGLEGSDYLSLTPLQHNTDGFFAALLKKSAN